MAKVYKNDKSWFEDFRDQFRSLNGQPFSKKVEHFFTYYWRLTLGIIIGIIAIVNIGWAIGEWLESHNEQLEALMERFFKDKDTFINFLFYAWWTISGLITVLFTWLTYRFFKRAQVINNKFLNV